ncbi:MAG TPA: hypothetical protein VGD57_03530 [Candidatus Dormibacteraeota bacterium]
MALARPLEVQPRPAAGPRASPTLIIGALLIGLFFALATAHYLIAPLDRFDEGVTLTKGAMAAAGRVPYRDFWNTYGPLDTYILAAAFKLIAVNVEVARALGAAVMVLIAATAYALMRGLGLRWPIRLLMTGLISVAPLSLATFNTPFLAILLGLAALLTFMAGLDRPGARWPALCGLMVGLIASCRPEFALALGGGLGVGYLVLALHPRSFSRRPGLLYLLTAVATSSALWASMAVLAGLQPIWLDIVVHAITIYARSRRIPIGQGHEGPVVAILGAAFVLVWMLGALRAFRQREDAHELARIGTLLVAGMLAFAWVFTRADGIHAMAAWPVTGVLLALLLQRRAASRPSASPRLEAGAGLAGLLLCCLAAGGLTFRDLAHPSTSAGVPRAGIAGERAWMPAEQLAELIARIEAATPQGQPIWVGLKRNDLVVFDDNSLYFLSGHFPGTVYDEALPGFTNTDLMERTIACQLERSGVTLAVLGPNAAPEPWNLSALPGSSYLDRWIAGRATSRIEIGPYELVRLRPGVAPSGRCPSSDGAAPFQGSPATR